MSVWRLMFFILFIYQGLSVAQVPMPAGARSWWKAENNFSDSIGNSHGQQAGGVGFIPGEVGQAFSLNGSVNNYMVVHEPFRAFSNQITVEYWVAYTGGSNAGLGQASLGSDNMSSNVWLMLFSPSGEKGFNVSFYVNDSGNWRSASATKASSPVAGIHHIAGVADANGTRIYLNGVLVSTTAGITSGILSNPSSVVTLGNDPRYPTQRRFSGLLDEVTIYDRALSDSEVSAIYNAGPAGKDLPPPPSIPTALPTSAVSFWKAENNAADSLSEHPGVMHQGATFTIGKVGQAFSFDGVKGYAEIPSPFQQFSSQITVEYWINVASGSLGSGLGQGTAGADNMSSNVWLMHLNGNNTLTWFVNDGGTWRSANIPTSLAGGWHHIAGVADTNGTRVYLDGALVGTPGPGIASGIQSNPFSVIHLGKDVRYSTGRFMNGALDEVTIYDHALTQSDILKIYQAGAVGKAPPAPLPSHAVSWWKAEHNPDDTLGRSPGQLSIDNQMAFTNAVVGKGFYFNHWDRYVLVKEPFRAFNSAVTTEMWVKLSSDLPSQLTLGRERFLISQGKPGDTNSRVLYMKAKADADANKVKIEWGVNDAGIVRTKTIEGLGVDTWYHIVCVADRTSTRIYKNGSDIGSPGAGIGTGIRSESTAILLLGKDSITDGENRSTFFDGVLDEVTIYDRALTPSEIQTIYYAGAWGKTSSAAVVPIPSNGVSWWKADNNINDSKGNSPAQLKNGATYAAGRVNQAFSFDGTDDYVKIAAPFRSFTNRQITVEYWANVSSVQSFGGLGQGTEGSDDMAHNVWLMEFNGTQSLSWYVNDSGTWRSTSTLGPVIGGWHHIAGVADDTSTRLYVDGVQVGTVGLGIASGIQFNPSSEIHLGKDVRYALGRFIGGALDEVTIYNRALSGSEIQEIYNAGGRGKIIPNYPPFGADNTVTIASDESSYSFAPQDFRFSDPDNTPANKFYAVKITTLPTPATGTLTTYGSPVSAGDFIRMTNGLAGTTWTSRTSSGSRDWISLASSADGRKLIAGTWGNYLYTSTNAGASWTTNALDANGNSLDTFGQNQITGIFTGVASSSDGTKLVTVLRQGRIFISSDSGQTWISRDEKRYWSAVASSSDGTKLIASDNAPGYIYTSSDSGWTWTERTSAGSRNWSAVSSSADGTKLVAVAASSQIYTSSDSGATWTTRDSTRNWTGVFSSADGSKLAAVVNGGQIYTSSDFGVSWTARENNRSWTGIASSSDGTVLLAGVNSGNLYVSTDSGVTWTARDTNRGWRSFAMAEDASRMVAGVGGTGAAGTIYTSADTHLVFTPANNSPLATFTFQVQDDGGKLNSGVDLDPTPRAMTIKSANVGPIQTVSVAPGQSRVSQVLPTTSGQAGLTASFSNNGGSSSATVTTAVYTSNPVAGTSINVGGGFVDLQINGADSSDTATVQFYYPSTITGAEESALILKYYTGTAWANLLSSGGATPAKNTTNNLDGTVSGGRFTVVFNNTSTPLITDLSGTVIAMAINRAPVAVSKDVVMSADGDCSANAFIDNGSYDLDEGDTATVIQTPAGPYPIGTTHVTLTVTDNHGASSSSAGTVTVIDNVPPGLAVPGPIMVENELGNCGAVVNFTVTAEDNCSSVNIVSTPASGSSFPVGTTTVTSVATDTSGNATTKTFTVTVNDVEKPSLTVPTSLVVTADAGQCDAAVTFTASASDNCPGVNIVSTPASESVFPLGTTTVTSVATDAAGNTTTKTFTVTVKEHDLIGRVVVLARNSAWLKQKSSIVSGDIMVDGISGGPFLSEGVELSIGQNVTTPAGFSLKANRISIGQKATIKGDMFFNSLDDSQKSTSAEAQHTPLSFPLFCQWPQFESAPAGAQDITSQQSQIITLSAGSYRDVVLKQKSTLILNGGTYNLHNLNLGQDTKVLFKAASVVRIVEKFSTEQKSILGPDAGSGIGAKDIVLYVNGSNGNNGELGSSPEAAKIGQDCSVWANIYAPNGTLVIDQKTKATGAFLARDVIVGQNVALTLDSHFGLTSSGGTLASLAPSTKNISSVPRSIRFDRTASGMIKAEFMGTPGASYVVQASEDLHHWTTVKEVQADLEGLIPFVEQNSSQARFYRVLSAPANLQPSGVMPSR